MSAELLSKLRLFYAHNTRKDVTKWSLAFSAPSLAVASIFTLPRFFAAFLVGFLCWRIQTPWRRHRAGWRKRQQGSRIQVRCLGQAHQQVWLSGQYAGYLEPLQVSRLHLWWRNRSVLFAQQVLQPESVSVHQCRRCGSSGCWWRHQRLPALHLLYEWSGQQ